MEWQVWGAVAITENISEHKLRNTQPINCGRHSEGLANGQTMSARACVRE